MLLKEQIEKKFSRLCEARKQEIERERERAARNKEMIHKVWYNHKYPLIEKVCEDCKKNFSSRQPAVIRCRECRSVLAYKTYLAKKGVTPEEIKAKEKKAKVFEARMPWPEEYFRVSGVRSSSSLGGEFHAPQRLQKTSGSNWEA